MPALENPLSASCFSGRSAPPGLHLNESSSPRRLSQHALRCFSRSCAVVRVTSAPWHCCESRGIPSSRGTLQPLSSADGKLERRFEVGPDLTAHNSRTESRRLLLPRAKTMRPLQSGVNACRHAQASSSDERSITEDAGRNQDRWGPASEVRAYAEDLPTQADLVTGGVTTVEAPTTKVLPDLDYLQELIAIQQQGPRNIGFFGTRNMGYLHQQLIEILSYAMIITNNHIFTSGAAGTNAAVIRGALRAERPELLTVILPQSLQKQPPESQELLQKVENLVEMPHNDHLPLIEASRICNLDILSHVQQVICFAFHDSRLLMETCEEAKDMRKIVTLFYLD